MKRRGRTAGASLAIALAFESIACSSGSDPSTVTGGVTSQCLGGYCAVVMK
jgi:hypothetical protein